MNNDWLDSSNCINIVNSRNISRVNRKGLMTDNTVIYILLVIIIAAVIECINNSLK